MSKSISAKLTSEVLELFSMYMEDNGEKLIEDARRKGEQPSSPPLIPQTRIEDHQNGRVFFANEDSGSGITVFYLHGGAYFMDFACNVTAFVGTCELFYPDVTKFFGMLDEDPSNELIVGEEMNHVYPLLPIKEAESAVEKIIRKVKR